MDKQQKVRTRRSHEVEQPSKRDSKPPHLGSTKDSSVFTSFDSNSDIGYKSGEIDSGKLSGKLSSLDTKSQSLKKEHNIRFDSGLGSDVFSPLPSESDIPFVAEDDEALSVKPVSQKQQQHLSDRLIWQDIYAQDKDGDTILHLAVIEARSDIIFPLIRQAPHPDFLDMSNDLLQTPLHLCTLMDKSNIVRRLVAAGATLDIQDHRGNTALHIAARNGDLDCVRALLEPVTPEEIADAQCPYDLYPMIDDLSYLLNMKNYEGQTSVHLAAMGGFKKVLECLYDHGANINDQEGKSGKTALHYAVQNARFEIIQILVSKCHANISANNYAGKTPVQVAWTLYKGSQSSQHASILEYLKSHLQEKWDSFSDSDSSYSDETEILESSVMKATSGKVI